MPFGSAISFVGCKELLWIPSFLGMERQMAGSLLSAPENLRQRQHSCFGGRDYGEVLMVTYSATLLKTLSFLNCVQKPSTSGLGYSA